jgi:fluoride exporter
MTSALTSSLLIALGGAIGAVLRYWTGRGLAAVLGSSWPWGTLLVNVLGGFAIGAVVALSSRELLSPASRLFLTAGLLGGFTTFSAFSLEVVQLAERGAVTSAVVYILVSVLLSVGGVFFGLKIFA